jgi:hypothetical protein
MFDEATETKNIILHALCIEANKAKNISPFFEGTEAKKIHQMPFDEATEGKNIIRKCDLY